MGAMSIEDILVTPLKCINVDGGDVLHALKQSDIGYSGFGEAYFSCINFNAVKAWKRHTKMTMNIIVPIGQVKFVFYSEIEKVFRVEEIGREYYQRLSIPPGIWFGFQGLREPFSLVLNIASIQHDPAEVDRLSPSQINFDWSNI